jgi:hypothetical protein
MRGVRMDCDYVCKGETEQEIMKNAEIHAVQDHHYKFIRKVVIYFHNSSSNIVLGFYNEFNELFSIDVGSQK